MDEIEDIHRRMKRVADGKPFSYIDELKEIKNELKDIMSVTERRINDTIEKIDKIIPEEEGDVECRA